MCTINDVEWISDFHSRILMQTDPLALLHQKETSRKTKQPVQQNNMQTDFYETQSQKSIIKIVLITLLLTTIIIGFCLTLGWIIAI